MAAKFFDPTLVRTSAQAVEFIRSILESSTEYSIIGEDLEGNIISLERGACILYGYQPEEVVGVANASILHSEADNEAGKPQEMREITLRTGHWDGVVERRRKDGTAFKARVVVTLRRDASGKAIGFLLMSKEIPNDAVSDAVRETKPFDSSIIGTVELARAASQMALQQTALDTAAAMFITDGSGVILWVNPAFTTTTGYTADEAIGKTPRLLKSGFHDEAFYTAFWKQIASGRIWRGEFANRKKDGSIYYVEHVVTPVRDENGVVTHFVDIMHDVTEQKVANDKLREADVQMRDLLEHSPAVLYALRLEGNTFVPRLASGNIKRLLGFEVSETLSREWWLTHLHPEDRAVAEESIAETIAKGTSTTEYRVRHRDGTYRSVEDNRRLVRDDKGRPAEVAGVWTDVTDRRRAQDETRESERRMRTMLNNLDLIAVMLDREARITYCNEYFLRLTGWSREEIIGRNWFEQVIPAADAARMRPVFDLAMTDSPVTRHYTNAIVTRSGELRTIHWNNSVLRSIAGAVIGVATIGADVTTQLLSEQEIRRSEERLRIIIDASTDGVWEWNVETGAVEWSDRAYAMLGYDRASFDPSSGSLIQAMHPDDLAATQKSLADHLENGRPYRVRFRVRHANGSYIPVFTRGQLRSDTRQMVGVFTDLSVLEHAEQQIREQAALIDQAHEAIVVRDLDDKVVFWSKGAERLYECHASEALGRRFDELLQIDPEKFNSAKVKLLATGSWAGEIEKHDRVRHKIVVDCSWTLLQNDRGEPKSIFSIDSDITERKSLEQQFFRAQRLESLGTLAGGIAHDLNNLLMPILMGVTLLKRLEPREKSLRAINNIESSVRRGADLVKQVLLFARGVEGSRVALDVVTIVQEVHAILESTFPKNISFVTNLPSMLGRVLGDATQLHQVVLNLCVNARDAMPAGGEITVTALAMDVDAPTAIKHGGKVAGRYVVVEVTDTGSGMLESTMDRVFEPFFTTKELTKGTGLGLSTARGIVHSHGGFIAVASKPGKGSTFCVYLPEYRGVSTASVVETAGEDPTPGHGELILVVDDEPAILDIMRQTLVSFGYAVVTAGNGAEAIALYGREHTRIAAVVTDVMMPVMDGHAFIAALREIDARVPIIAMSGHADPSDLPAVTTAGATTFLSKPYSAGVILRTVSSVLHPAAA